MEEVKMKKRNIILTHFSAFFQPHKPLIIFRKTTGLIIIMLFLIISIPAISQSPIERIKREKDLDENKIKIFLKSDTVVSAPLLCVRDSGIIIFQEYISQTFKGKILNREIKLIRNEEIKKIAVPGKSMVGNNMLIGLSIGAGVGVCVGFISGDDEKGLMCFSAREKALIFGVAFGFTGLLFGIGIGIGNSISEKEFEPLSAHNLDFLKPLARYKTEPEFLNQIK
jgi:hypothetical protein